MEETKLEIIIREETRGEKGKNPRGGG